ncbi:MULTISPECIES: hypothetical protein [Hyphomicrobium]|jgi:hypothetical protein|uniref:hypothetical protein n=1 Tax=Hyphomicrobium TaxID=81 RepID=UPI00036033F8|nr:MULTISPECIES: hypothetical protein [Hyphomicrobium]WBT37577.1 hypothetical protein PE058_18220 [Hyphomicrobium sp. DMF-1]
MITSLISRRAVKRWAGAIVVPVALSLGACSADDVELNGKLFDAVGLNNLKSKSAEPKMAERAPLVMPPNLERVPEPGAPAEAVANDVTALVDDPDRKAKTNRAELERQQAEYCKKNYDEAKARGDDNADLASGPLGPCRGSVLTAIQQWNKGSEDDDE